MKLYEFQGKQLFKEHGIPVPKSILLVPSEQQESISTPIVLKAQVLTGGRGKAGGVKICDNASEFTEILNKLFSMEIKGEAVKAILAEEKSEILREFYVSITYNGTLASPVLVFSASGGVEIENVAKENPENIITIPINPLIGITDYQARFIANTVGYKDIADMTNLLDKLYQVFSKCDASLVEINPLAVTPSGLVALDSKVVLDNNARYRHKILFENILKEQSSIFNQPESLGREDTITYVPLSGTVGLISDGAGTGMLTLDLIKDAGGEAANFCELGGITNSEVMYNAMSEVLKSPDVKSLLVVLIGGFNRMDEMAEGIIKYKEDHGLNVPAVIRMCGTMEDVGKELMKNANIPTYDNLLEAVNNAVLLAGGR